MATADQAWQAAADGMEGALADMMGPFGDGGQVPGTQPHTQPQTQYPSPHQPYQPMYPPQPPLNPDVAALTQAVGQLAQNQGQLLNQMAQIQTLLQRQGQQQYQAPPAQPQLPMAIPRTHAHKELTLTKFKGERGSSAYTFLIELRGYFQQHPQDYPTVNGKIWYALMNMEGKANDWKYRILDPLTDNNQRDPFNTWEEFERAFKLTFERIGDEAEAMAELKHFKQGSSSVAEYQAHFEMLAIRTHLSEFDKRERYYDGLAGRIKDLLVGTSKPIATYDELRTVSVQLDNHWAQRQWEKGQDRVQHFNNPRTTNQTFQPRPQAPPHQPARDPNAMEIDASKACFNCGKMGHFKRNCRSPPKGSQGQQIKATGQENQPATGTGISPEVMSMVTSIQASLRQVTERILQMEVASQPKTQESVNF